MSITNNVSVGRAGGIPTARSEMSTGGRKARTESETFNNSEYEIDSYINSIPVVRPNSFAALFPWTVISTNLLF